MTLDDLAKAAYEARDDGKIPAHWWAQEGEAAKRKYRQIALAVASAVLEAIEAEGIDDIRRNVAALQKTKENDR